MAGDVYSQQGFNHGNRQVLPPAITGAHPDPCCQAATSPALPSLIRYHITMNNLTKSIENEQNERTEFPALLLNLTFGITIFITRWDRRKPGIE